MVWIAVLSLVVSIATMVVVLVRLGARGVVLLGNDGEGGAEAVPLPTLSPGEGGAEAGALPTLSPGGRGAEAGALPTLSPGEGGAEAVPLPTPSPGEGTGKGDRGSEGAGGGMAGVPIRMEGGNVVVDGDLVVRGNVSCYTRK